MTTDARVCLYPSCPDDNPVLFSWLGSEYCSWECRWKHRRSLAEQPAPDLVIVVAPDTSRFEAAIEEVKQQKASNVHPVVAAHAEVQRSFQALSEMVGPPCPDGDLTGFARLRKRWLG